MTHHPIKILGKKHKVKQKEPELRVLKERSITTASSNKLWREETETYSAIILNWSTAKNAWSKSLPSPSGHGKICMELQITIRQGATVKDAWSKTTGNLYC
mmetsp:Transcript_57232/g.68430  ORF Transcript_57232/g.68430 Transcript_57232/m.68430 type:complete len:101 (-) Transcript_57232:71-373(-)